MHKVEFDSLESLLRYVETAPHIPGRLRVSEKNDHESLTWTGGLTLPEAIRSARYGWKEGYDKLAQSMSAIPTAISFAKIPSMGLDVAGSFPFIPAAVAGDPLNMWSLNEDSSKTKPVIRIYQRLSYTANVNASNIMNFGAAVLSLVDGLEDAGYRTEIFGYRSSETLYKEINFQTIKLKEASEPLDVSRLSFPFANPAMLRRVLFKLSEVHPNVAFCRVYGKSCAADPKLFEPNSIVIPTAPGVIPCGTLKDAVEYVKGFVKASPWADAIEFE